jgi:thiamine biosynthesis lipoprotein
MTRERPPRNLFLLLCCGVVMLILVSLRQAQERLPVVNWHGPTMGTTYEVKLAGVTVSDEELDRLTRVVDRELVAVNAAMSTYIADSEISIFNRMTEVEEPQDISERFIEVMRRSKELHDQTGGAFNPALGPLIDLWGFGAGSNGGAAPTLKDVKERLEIIRFDNVVVEDGRLRKRDPRVEINLSAIAKGYAVDRVHRLLQEEGFENIYVEIGGEVVCSGVNPSGEAWRIGI